MKNQNKNLIDLLQQHAIELADKPAFTFIKNNEEFASLSFSELFHQANIIAQHLALKIQPQSRVILLYPPGLEFITAF